MPASHTRGASHRLSRPAFENLQRTKPRGCEVEQQRLMGI